MGVNKLVGLRVGAGNAGAAKLVGARVSRVREAGNGFPGWQIYRR